MIKAALIIFFLAPNLKGFKKIGLPTLNLQIKFLKKQEMLEQNPTKIFCAKLISIILDNLMVSSCRCCNFVPIPAAAKYYLFLALSYNL